MKGVLAGIHGVGEKVRGEFNKGVDGVVGDVSRFFVSFLLFLSDRSFYIHEFHPDIQGLNPFYCRLAFLGLPLDMCAVLTKLVGCRRKVS